MADQRPVIRRAARQRLTALTLQLPDNPRRPPRRVRPADLQHPRLHHRRHLMRARLRPRRLIGQAAQATVIGIAAQPPMDRLPGYPYRRATSVTDAPSSRTSSTARYRCSATPSSTSTPGSLPATSLTDRRQAPRTAKSRELTRSVAYLPELLSPSSRNRVLNLSPRNRNRGVQHLPGSHTTRGPVPPTNHQKTCRRPGCRLRQPGLSPGTSW